MANAQDPPSGAPGGESSGARSDVTPNAAPNRPRRERLGAPDSGGGTLLEVGVITRPHGITGEVKVQTTPEYLAVLEGVRRVYLGDAGHGTRVRGYRVHQGAALLQLEGVNTRNDAEALRGVRVQVRTADLPELGEGEYYSHQLLGMRVLDETGRELGTIGEVMATGSNDVYVVNTPEGKELLLPAIESVIRKVDVDARHMEVNVPEGLRD